MVITLHKKYGVAPCLTYCQLCGGDSEEIALLGISCNTIVQKVFVATGGKYGAESYDGSSHVRIPSREPCNKCTEALKNGGIILIAADTSEVLRLDKSMVDRLVGRVADARGRVLDFEKIRGKIVKLPKAFWVQDKEGNIRLRDLKEWTEPETEVEKIEREKHENKTI